ncbi:Lrp/AsnC family transcriptional regulator [Neokomagataea thailandica]|uniref:Transcriptional regulator n=1 Tax=Neokomagataea tanensis NBRC 106556 TaxID=1223519 RepID=A0ABQ0QIV6_9PROT|nr:MULTISPECIES: winged helix-turn-helix transcriptional regulator [Neokomagataea]GBR46293.1 transcriptional regulator [Neokomagataea tanensis NBRC 106556]
MAIAPKLDRIDLKILAQLQKNGRLTNVELANRVGLSASPCLIRVKRLETAGYIVGYGAQIALQKISSVMTVFTEVTLSDHRRDDFFRFETAMHKVESLVEAHLISGGYDYLLKFMVRNIDHYQETIEALLDQNIGIEKYFSYIVIKSPILKPAFLIENLTKNTERSI